MCYNQTKSSRGLPTPICLFPLPVPSSPASPALQSPSSSMDDAGTRPEQPSDNCTPQPNPTQPARPGPGQRALFLFWYFYHTALREHHDGDATGKQARQFPPARMTSSVLSSMQDPFIQRFGCANLPSRPVSSPPTSSRTSHLAVPSPRRRAQPQPQTAQANTSFLPDRSTLLPLLLLHRIPSLPSSHTSSRRTIPALRHLTPPSLIGGHYLQPSALLTRYASTATNARCCTSTPARPLPLARVLPPTLYRGTHCLLLLCVRRDSIDR